MLTSTKYKIFPILLDIFSESVSRNIPKENSVGILKEAPSLIYLSLNVERVVARSSIQKMRFKPKPSGGVYLEVLRAHAHRTS